MLVENTLKRLHPEVLLLVLPLHLLVVPVAVLVHRRAPAALARIQQTLVTLRVRQRLVRGINLGLQTKSIRFLVPEPALGGALHLHVLRRLRVVGSHVRGQQLRVQKHVRTRLHRGREILRVERIGGAVEVLVVYDIHLLEVLQLDDVVGRVVEQHQVRGFDLVPVDFGFGFIGVAVQVVGDLDVFGWRGLVHFHVAVGVEVVVEDVGVEVFGFFQDDQFLDFGDFGAVGSAIS